MSSNESWNDDDDDDDGVSSVMQGSLDRESFRGCRKTMMAVNGCNNNFSEEFVRVVIEIHIFVFFTSYRYVIRFFWSNQ